MLHSLNDLKRFSLEASDDTMGSVHDLYFDDQDWSVRYLVANSGFWFFGRDVLISVSTLGAPDMEKMTIPVSLTRAQVKDLPSPDTHKPVSEQNRYDLESEGWPLYLAGGEMSPLPTFIPLAGFSPIVLSHAGNTDAQEPEPGDPHLRSAREVEGYAIAAKDGAIGKVRDVIVDRESWRVRYLTVDTGNWLAGKEVVLSVDWIESLDWVDRTVSVGVTKQAIEDSPPIGSLKELKRSYEEELYRSYGYPGYWI